MSFRLLILALFNVAAHALPAWPAQAFEANLAPVATADVAPVQLIIDTDLGFDVDDVGAIAVAHALADQGKVDILGVVCNTGQ